MTIKLKVILSVATGYLFITLSVATMKYMEVQESTIKNSAEKFQQFESSFNRELEAQGEALSIGLDYMLNDPVIITAFANRDRESIHKRTFPIYKDIIKTKI